jgi:hypothetical protein
MPQMFVVVPPFVVGERLVSNCLHCINSFYNYKKKKEKRKEKERHVTSQTL